MCKKLCLLSLFIFHYHFSFAQQFSLNNSGTLYDSFENPVQKSTVKDLSKKYALNVFFPSVSFDNYFKGDATFTYKSLLFNNILDATNLPVGVSEKKNQLKLKVNVYLLMFKIFKTVQYNREIGFSYQIKNETFANLTNETFSVLNDYRLFTNANYDNVFNNNGSNQAYHQLSISYRENYNSKLAFGAKLGFLSGIAYNKLAINESSIGVNAATNTYILGVKGKYLSSHGLDKLGQKNIIPGFQNPGVSLNVGTSYTAKSGYYFTTHIKDLGFIKWNKKSAFNFDLNGSINVNNAGNNSSLTRETLVDFIKNSASKQGFTTLTNAKIEVLTAKSFGSFTPNIILSKSIFNEEAAIAIINNYQTGIFNFSVNSIYDLQRGIDLGGQFLLKSPNVEWYFGSEKLLPTYYFSKGYLKKDPLIGKGDIRANLYIGFALKFGKSMQPYASSDIIPGLNDKESNYVKQGGGKKKAKKAAKKSKM